MSIHFVGRRLWLDDYGQLRWNVVPFGKQRLIHGINCASGNVAAAGLFTHTLTGIIYLRFLRVLQSASANQRHARLLVCVTYALIIGKQNKNKTDLITIIYF